MPGIEIEQEQPLDVLDQRRPALSSTSDMPVVETKPDSSPPAPEKTPSDPEATESAAPGPDADQDAGKTGDSETATESAEVSPGAPDGEPKKQSKGVQKLLDKLRAEAEEARRAAQQEREERLKLYESINRPPAEEAKAEDVEPVKPTRQDYPDDDDWDQALMAYAEQRSEFISKRTIQATIERERQEQERKAIANAQEEVRQRHQARVDAALERYPDFHEVAESPSVKVSIPMAHAILHSDMGADVQYYLGANPDEAARIVKLAPPLQLVELGKIEAKLTVKAEATPPKRPEPQLSSAPPPIRPLKSGEGSPVVKDPGTMTMDEYKAWRKKQNGEARR